MKKELTWKERLSMRPGTQPDTKSQRLSKSKALALHKAKEGVGQGTGTPKSKWGAKQGNWHKVMPGDR